MDASIVQEIKLTLTIIDVIPFLTSSHACGVVRQIAHVLLGFHENTQQYNRVVL